MRNSPDRPGGNDQLRSVQNALRVLVLLKDQRALRVSEVGAALGVAKSTAYRLLATLEQEDFVRRDRSGHRYRAGPVLYDIGLSAVGDLDVRRKARRPLETLSEETGETVQLLVPEGRLVRVVDGIDGTQVLHVRARVGLLLPMDEAAGGKVLLASMPPGEVRALFSDGVPSRDGKRPVGWERLQTELAVIRRNGYALNFSESEIGLHAVAAAVHDRFRRPIAAVSITGPSARITTAQVPSLAVRLRATVGEVGRALA